MWQEYYTPHTIDEALQLLAENKSRAKIIAGGTTLIPEIQLAVKAPKVIIDISAIPNLDAITQDEEKIIHLGPLVTHNHVVGSDICMDRAFPLAKACWEVGAPQIRNRGTVAGNLVSASPASDTIPPLYALGASVTLQSIRGKRTLSCEDFLVDTHKTAIEADEIIVDIFFAPMKGYQVGTFMKLGLRRFQAISVVNVVVILSMLGDTVTSACIALGSVAPTVIRSPNAERFLTGKVLTSDVMAHAGALAAQTIIPINDIRGSAQYRRYMTETLTRHAVESLYDGTERDSIPPKPVMLWGKTDGHFPTKNGHANLHTEAGNEPIVTTINGQPRTIYGGNDKTLLQMLREKAGLTGVKDGCSEGECGACAVLLDGIAVMSCMVSAPRVHGSQITTIEGVADGETLHPVQQAFIDEGAVQCGYCTPGFIMSGVSLLDERNHPTRDEIKQAITGNLCRCTGYYKILQALETGSSKM